MNHIWKILMVLLLGTLLSALILTAAACNDEDEATFDEEDDLKTLENMEAAIDVFIGTADCVDAGDCRVLPFGDKPCGGPWRYKICSATAVDSVVLADMIIGYNEFNTLLNTRYNWASDCMFVMPPDIGCVDGHCVAVEKPKANH